VVSWQGKVWTILWASYFVEHLEPQMPSILLAAVVGLVVAEPVALGRQSQVRLLEEIIPSALHPRLEFQKQLHLAVKHQLLAIDPTIQMDQLQPRRRNLKCLP